MRAGENGVALLGNGSYLCLVVAARHILKWRNFLMVGVLDSVSFRIFCVFL